jgi:hypothetical protein
MDEAYYITLKCQLKCGISLLCLPLYQLLDCDCSTQLGKYEARKQKRKHKLQQENEINLLRNSVEEYELNTIKVQYCSPSPHSGLNPIRFLLQETNLTPLRSLRPLGWRILMYLEAMRNPMKQTVNTLAIGNTAYLSMDSTDVPEPPCAAVASASIRELSTMMA